MSEMTTDKIIDKLRRIDCTHADAMAAAARLSALDKDAAAAVARAEKAEALYAKAWAECEEWRRVCGRRWNGQGAMHGWYTRDSAEAPIDEADAHDATRREAGL